MIWSQFENEYFNGEEWIKENIYYMGDLTKDSIDYTTDWRFKEIEGKRKQVKFIKLKYE